MCTARDFPAWIEELDVGDQAQVMKEIACYRDRRDQLGLRPTKPRVDPQGGAKPPNGPEMLVGIPMKALANCILDGRTKKLPCVVSDVGKETTN